MNKQAMPVLAKSSASGGGSAESKEKTYNAITMAALQEANEIMSGKKKVKWSRLPPETTKEEAKEVLGKILGS